MTTPDDEIRTRRRSRNIALGLVLVGMVVLFYFITIARMS